MRFMCLTTEPLQVFVWRWPIRSESQPSFHRTATRTKRALATRGDRSGNIGLQPTAENREVIRQNIMTLETTRWQYTHGVANPESVAARIVHIGYGSAGASRKQRDSARSVSRLCIECKALSEISGVFSQIASRPCSRSGARTIRSSFRPEQRHFGKIYQMRRFSSSIPAILQQQTHVVGDRRGDEGVPRGERRSARRR